MAPPIDRPSVFLDADVLIAGSASSKGAAHLILRIAELSLIDAVSSAQAREEAERHLKAKLPAALPAFRLIAEAACRWVDDPPREELASLKGAAHPKDLPILAAAVREGCQSLLTFNARDSRPRDISIRVEKPGDFLARLRATLAGLAAPSEPPRD